LRYISSKSTPRHVWREAGIHPNPEPIDGNRRTASLGGVAVTLFIVVLALVIARKLQVRCLIENCVFAGGTNCQHVADNLRVSRAVEHLVDEARDWIAVGQKDNAP
jgi:hypothetical protein